jgi:hypothetical protein
MPFIAGLMAITLFRVGFDSSAKPWRIVVISVFAGAGALGLFLLLSFVRGDQSVHELVGSLLGYTLASYNRLAALLLGSLHYQYEGKGAYLFPYLVDSQKINDLLGLREVFGWPTSSELWQSEFSSTMAAGLTSSYIWAGAFGYVYADLGWLAPLYLLAVGLGAGHLWRMFCRGHVIGVVLYPWMAFSILFWIGWNILLTNWLITLVMATACLWTYDTLLSSRSFKLKRAGSNEITLPSAAKTSRQRPS